MIITTERLILRPWRDEDAESLFNLAKDPDVGPACGWPPHQTVADSLYAIRNILNDPNTFAILNKETEEIVGDISIMEPRNTVGKGENECELGFWIGKPYWGNGYMKEAADALINLAFNEMGMKTVWCGYYEGNEKSKRVQEKIGFKFHHTENVHLNLLNVDKVEYYNVIVKSEE